MSKVNTSSSRGKNVVAHILDTNEGYKKEAWDVGEAIHSDVADYLSGDGSLFVVVTYDNGRAEAAIFKQEVWKVLKRLFDAVDQGGAKALEAALHEVGGLLAPPVSGAANRNFRASLCTSPLLH